MNKKMTAAQVQTLRAAVYKIADAQAELDALMVEMKAAKIHENAPDIGRIAANLREMCETGGSIDYFLQKL